MQKLQSALKLMTLPLCLLLTPPAHAGYSSGYYTDDDDFYVAIDNMLDFDQVRASDGASTPGLPGDGAMYCAPTSTMNMFAYLGMNGFPTLDPGDEDWYDTSSSHKYNSITEAISDLGGLMGTTATGGTTSSGLYTGATQWLATHYTGSSTSGLFFVQLLASDSISTTVGRAAFLAQDGLVNLCYGYYTGGYSVSSPSDELGSGTLDTRNGGHCVTFSSGESLSARESNLKVMDPIHVSSGDDSFSQSVMMERDWTTDDVAFTDKDWVCSAMQVLTAKGETRVIDEIDTIRTWSVMFVDPSLDLVLMGDIKESIFSGDPVLDAVMRPDQVFTAIVTRGPGSTLSRALLLDRRDGETTSIQQGGVVRVAFSRFLELYSSSDRRLARYGVESGQAVELNAVLLDRAPSALEWIDATDELWALDGKKGRILAFSRTLSGAPRVLQGDTIFSKLAADPNVRMTAVPGHRVALLAPGTGTVALFDEGPSGLVLRARYDGARGARDVTSMDGGDLLVAMSDGTIVELAADPYNQLITTTGPAQGLRSSGIIEAARSRTNFDPALHSGWTNGRGR